MWFDFVWQQLIIFAGGLATARVVRFYNMRVRRTTLRRYFGSSRLDDGVTVVLQIFGPLSRDNFGKASETTIAVKNIGRVVGQRVPIYGDVFHLDDYLASQEIFKLVRGYGAREGTIVADSEPIQGWSSFHNLVLLGSPNVNLAIADALSGVKRDGRLFVVTSRGTLSLDSYRVEVRSSAVYSLGVTETHALAVVTRVPHPSQSGEWVTGIWGCRAETTLQAAKYFRANFGGICKFGRRSHQRPLVIVLAASGNDLSILKPMLIATDDAVIEESPELLDPYRRGEITT